MKEEIKNIIDENFGNVKNSLEDIYSNNDSIKELVDNQNEKAQEEIEYRKELIRAINQLKEEGYNILYDDSQSVEELEKLINSINE